MISESKISCYVLDDEPIAVEIVSRFISRIDSLELVGESNDPITALKQVKELKPQLLFLDINMPELTGFELLDILGNQKPFIIITSAYPEYALKGYEFDVIDYLLKPISFAHFTKSIERVQERLSLIQNTFGGQNLQEFSTKKQSSFYLKADKKNLKVQPEEISYIESLEDYIKINFINPGQKVFVVRLPLHIIEKELPDNQFIRVHRSYIINSEVINYVQGNQLILKMGKTIPIGRTYQEMVKQKINEITLSKQIR